jgi:TPR repeat protein
MDRKATILALSCTIVAGCAGMNPNPGERTVDMAWTSGDYGRAFRIAEPSAMRGEPWAQLRLGIFYYTGSGVERDPQLAMLWYEKAMVQTASGGWSDGKIVGAVGKAGYFNQNSDALIAEFNIAQALYEDDGVARDLPKAYVHVSNVINHAGGKSVFFCCEFDRARYFNPDQFAELKAKIEAAMSPTERAQVQVPGDGAHN